MVGARVCAVPPIPFRCQPRRLWSRRSAPRRRRRQGIFDFPDKFLRTRRVDEINFMPRPFDGKNREIERGHSALFFRRIIAHGVFLSTSPFFFYRLPGKKQRFADGLSASQMSQNTFRISFLYTPSFLNLLGIVTCAIIYYTTLITIFKNVFRLKYEIFFQLFLYMASAKINIPMIVEIERRRPKTTAIMFPPRQAAIK